MSKQAERIYLLLSETFPHNIITKEYYVKYKGHKLFFDFYMKDYALLFEIQGRQHSEYVNHFHGDKQGFLEVKKRDNLKIQYCQENDFTLVVINYDDDISTKEDLLSLINELIRAEQWLT